MAVSRLVRAALTVILTTGSLSVVACSGAADEDSALPVPHIRAAQVVERAPSGQSRHLALLEPVRRARLAPRYGGQVTEILVDEEAEVQAGELLVKLAAGDAKAQVQSASGALAQARERVKDNARELKRSEQLVAKGAEAARGAEQRRSTNVELRGAKRQAQGQLAQAQDRVKASRLKAPFTGTVTRIETEVGEYADVRSPVMILADLSELAIEVKLSEREAALHDQDQLSFTALIRDQEVATKLDWISTEADEGTSTFTARLVIDNLDAETGGRRFRAGESVEVFVTGKRGVPRPAVPTTAIRWAGPSSYVLRLDDDRVIQVPVNVLDDAGDLVTIDSELALGDWVVASGPLNLRSGDRVEVGDVLGGGRPGDAGPVGGALEASASAGPVAAATDNPAPADEDEDENEDQPQPEEAEEPEPDGEGGA